MRYIDVVKIAREIAFCPNVYVPRNEKLALVPDYIKDADNVLSAIEVAGIPLSIVDIEQVRRIAEERSRKLISVFRLPPEEETKLQGGLDGLIKFYQSTFVSGAIIKVKGGTCCRRRFVTLKELMHVYIVCVNGDPTFKQNIHAGKLLEEAWESRTKTPNDANMELDPETAALYMAIEVAIPWHTRDTFDYLLRDMKQQPYQIAKAYMVPQYIIDQVLKENRDVYGEHGNYLQFSRHINSKLDLGTI